MLLRLMLFIFAGSFLGFQPANAASLKCSDIFQKQSMSAVPWEISSSSNKTKKILQISYDYSQNFSLIVDTAIQRLVRAEKPSVALVFVQGADFYQSVRTISQPALDRNIRVASTLKEIQDLIANPSKVMQSAIFLVDASHATSVISEIAASQGKAMSLPLDGVYFEEKSSVTNHLPREQMAMVVEASAALLYGVSFGRLASQVERSVHYDKVVALDYLMDISGLTKSDTAWMGLEKLRDLLKENNIISRKQYETFRKQEGRMFLPPNPDITYAERGWLGWDFLFYRAPPAELSVSEAKNTQISEAQSYALMKAAKETRLLYEEFQKLVAAQNFSRRKQFLYWYYKNTPAGGTPHPQLIYAKSGWQGWEHFLGQTKWMTWAEARLAVREAGIRSMKEFNEWHDRPMRLPSDPAQSYEEYIDAADFLGNPELRISPRLIKVLDYEDSHKITVEQGLKSSHEYRRWKKPPGVPYDPQRIYAGKGWISWPVYLGLKSTEQQKFSTQKPKKNPTLYNF